MLAELDAATADGIGLTGQMHGLVALDADRRPLRPAILWNDGRSQPQADAIAHRLGVARLVELSGNLALAGFTAPKLMWMAEHEPELHARIAHVLLPKDYVRLRLCDMLATDVSDASGTSLLDVAAVAGRRSWPRPSGWIRQWLPVAHESGEVSGQAFGGDTGRRGRRRSGRRGARRRRHQRRRTGLDRARHLRRRVRGARRGTRSIPRAGCTPSATRWPIAGM